MAPNRASDVPAADWLSQTRVKNYRYFSRVVTRFFSVLEIPIKHSSLHNKTEYISVMHLNLPMNGMPRFCSFSRRINSYSYPMDLKHSTNKRDSFFFRFQPPYLKSQEGSFMLTLGTNRRASLSEAFPCSIGCCSY